MKTRAFFLGLLMTVASVLTAAAQNEPSTRPPAEQAAVDANAPATLATRNHVLQPLDKVAFFIAEDPAPVRPNERKTLDLAVSAAGQLEVPISRCCEQTLVFDVRGKTVEQAEKQITDQLLAEYYQKATVQLRLIDTTKRVGQVWLTGAVKGNTFQLNPGKTYTLWEVLTAVGLQEFANKANVEVTRREPGSDKTKTFKVDVAAAEKKPELDIEVQDGDRIKVKEKWFNLR